MENLKIRFFGPFTLSLGEKSVCETGARGHRQWRLIKYLILNRERPVSRRELVDVVFGYGAYSGRFEEALNALNAMIHRARKTLSSLGLEPSKVIIYERNSYRFLLPEGTEIDCELFEYLSARVFSGGSLEEMKPHALGALEVYGGFFLDKNFPDEKTRLAVEKYHDTYKRIFNLACGALKRERDFITISEISERASAIDPFCEDFYIERVSALLEAGEKARAAEIYRKADEFFESRTELIPSERFRQLGEAFEGKARVSLLLPEKYSDKTEKIRSLLIDALGEGADVKISLI